MSYRYILGLVFLFLFSAGNTWAAPVVIKFAHLLEPDTPKGFLAETFKKEIEKRLPGEVEVEIYPRGELYNGSEVIGAVMNNDVQMASPALSKFTSYTRKLEIFDLPFLFEDLEAAQKFQASAYGKDLLVHMRSQGILGLGYLHNGMKQLLSDRPLRRPEDAVGMNFRVMPSDVLAAQFEAVGANSMKAAFPDLPRLMQEGSINGHESSWSLIYTHKLYELQPYITNSDHGYLGNMVVVSTKFWDTVSPEMRKEIQEALKLAITKANTLAYIKTANDHFKVFQNGNITMLALTESERRRWVDTMRPVWDRFAPEVGMDMINAAEASNRR